MDDNNSLQPQNNGPKNPVDMKHVAIAIIAIVVVACIIGFAYSYSTNKTSKAPRVNSTKTTIQSAAATTSIIPNEINAACPCLGQTQIGLLFGVSPPTQNFSAAYLPNATAIVSNSSILSFGKLDNNIFQDLQAGWVINYNSTVGNKLNEYVIKSSDPSQLFGYYNSTLGTSKTGSGILNNFRYFYSANGTSQITLIGFKDNYTVILDTTSIVGSSIQPQAIAENLSYTV